MIERIMVNLDVVEALLFFWQSIKERKKVSERFIFDVIAMPGITCVYDEEFNAESVRKTLSAITNRESFAGKNRKEGRFYSNNLWMLEDLSYTEKMMQPLKKLNLQSLLPKLNSLEDSKNYKEIEVIFSPFHSEEYRIKNNKLIINFFGVKPIDESEGLNVGDKDLLTFIEEKLIELMS